MQKLIGLSGPKGVGKNFVAEALATALESMGISTHITSFAGPLKEVGICMAVPRSLAWGDQKEKEMPSGWDWSQVVPELRRRYKKSEGSMTTREFLQIIGTDVIRNGFAEDAWLHVFRRNLAHIDAQVVFVTDARFPNEIELVKEMDGEAWMVEGPRGHSGSGDGHASEHAWRNQNFDHCVLNAKDATAESIAADYAGFIADMVTDE